MFPFIQPYVSEKCLMCRNQRFGYTLSVNLQDSGKFEKQYCKMFVDFLLFFRYSWFLIFSLCNYFRRTITWYNAGYQKPFSFFPLV